TDMDATRVKSQLQRIDRVLEFSQRYWQRPLVGRIRCYLVHDLATWRSFDFPEPTARRVLRRIGGGTNLQRRSDGKGNSQAVVYATTEPGVLEHEVVHAYCFQTFGHGGPAWYREGMAELIGQRLDTDLGAPCRASTLQLLRQSSGYTLAQLTKHEGDFTAALKNSAGRHAQTQEKAAVRVSLDDDNTMALKVGIEPQTWSDDDHAALQAARIDYAHSWAACYFLSQHRSYRERFRCYGQHVMCGAKISLADAFGDATPQVEFEFAQFLNNIEAGYRVDLCHWQWHEKQPARPLEIGAARVVQVRSALGYQPAGVQVESGSQYRISATGSWQLGPESEKISADGDDDGGQLEIVTLEGHTLSSPTLLGTNNLWRASRTGTVYLRCRDAWGELSDNRGSMSVHIKRIE
ncbi:MAG: hypothetical protein KDB23_28310, partial [Planctomycetales bacterium]|nr:hypothetical protein [Planctomycetales bacterium]